MTQESSSTAAIGSSHGVNRRLTIKWIAVGMVTFVIVFLAAWALVPRPVPVHAPIDRLLLALQYAAGSGFVLLIMLQGLWRVRDTPEAEDPLAGKESRGFRINQRVMTNTMEQAAIFVPIYVGFSVRMAPEQVYWLPLLMGFWCLARLVFWVGYRQALHMRAIGMDWTTGTTMVTAALFLMTLM